MEHRNTDYPVEEMSEQFVKKAISTTFGELRIVQDEAGKLQIRIMGEEQNTDKFIVNDRMVKKKVVYRPSNVTCGLKDYSENAKTDATEEKTLADINEYAPFPNGVFTKKDLQQMKSYSLTTASNKQ